MGMTPSAQQHHAEYEAWLGEICDVEGGRADLRRYMSWSKEATEACDRAQIAASNAIERAFLQVKGRSPADAEKIQKAIERANEGIRRTIVAESLKLGEGTCSAHLVMGDFLLGVDASLRRIEDQLRGNQRNAALTDDYARFLTLKEDSLQYALTGDWAAAKSKALTALGVTDRQGFIMDAVPFDAELHLLLAGVALAALRQEGDVQTVRTHAMTAIDRAMHSHKEEDEQAAAMAARMMAFLSRMDADWPSSVQWSNKASRLEKLNLGVAQLEVLVARAFVESDLTVGCDLGRTLLIWPEVASWWTKHPARRLNPLAFGAIDRSAMQFLSGLASRMAEVLVEVRAVAAAVEQSAEFRPLTVFGSGLAVDSLESGPLMVRSLYDCIHRLSADQSWIVLLRRKLEDHTPRISSEGLADSDIEGGLIQAEAALRNLREEPMEWRSGLLKDIGFNKRTGGLLLISACFSTFSGVVLAPIFKLRGLLEVLVGWVSIVFPLVFVTGVGLRAWSRSAQTRRIRIAYATAQRDLALALADSERLGQKDRALRRMQAASAAIAVPSEPNSQDLVKGRRAQGNAGAAGESTVDGDLLAAAQRLRSSVRKVMDVRDTVLPPHSAPSG